MRPEPNKEIDLLLRQLARRDGAPVSEIEEQHLDADELNSYVANALPAAARARYTEHLADCSNCRKMVAQLSAAEGPIALPPSAPVVAPSGLRSFLASLFSPMVLRYAVPALGLIVIAVVGIVVLRQEQRGTSVARIENTDQNKSVLQIPAETPIVTKQEAPPRRTVVAPAANQDADATTAAEAPRPAPQAAPVEVEAPPPVQEPAKLQDAQKEKKAEAPEPTANTADTAKERADEATKRPAKFGAAAPMTETAKARREIRAAQQGEAAGAGTAAATTGTSTSSARDSNSDEAYLSEAAETRSVAGRRFRKSGSAWIDTAYNSSSAVTNVARGSEQYRALIADEPSIRTIAEALEGQIIVVWKGRTYRIR